MRDWRWLRTIIVATALVAVASLCHLSCLYEETQARVADQGNYCWRIGPRLNQNGDEAGATWSEDGESWHD